MVAVTLGVMLDDLDLAMLDLERGWFRHSGSKANAIAALGLSETRYYLRLNALIDRPEALAHDPFTVKRLQRLRERRRQQRAAAMFHA